MTLKTRVDRLASLALEHLAPLAPATPARSWGRFVATVLTKPQLASICSVLRMLHKFRKATSPTASYRDLPPDQLEEIAKVFTPEVGQALRNAKAYFDAHPDVLPPLPEGQYFHSFSEAERTSLRDKVRCWCEAHIGDKNDAQ